MDWQIIACMLITTTLITISPVVPLSPEPPQLTTEPPDTDDLWWTQAGRSLGLTIKDCLALTSPMPTAPRNEQIRKQVVHLSTCLKHYASLGLKHVLESDVIPLMDGVDLVKINSTERRASRADSRDDASLSGWRNMLIDSLADVLNTHAIRLSLQELQVAGTGTHSETARRRHRNKHQMMPLMAFGLVGLGMILVPMGFQFLAVLGGKALLLAKMALILTSIQGLKKVAHSHINYGLYHSAPEHPWYDRKAEDIEHPYDTYYGYSPYPEHLAEYKRYTRP